ncbi:MAG TPA: Rieske 2Fe-2S domain-containing protein [Acidimicrobiales bacterium]|nr:Rieske 2Fe-2S domain-containing protein [Acidimicrobiales bacterium]
MNLHDVAARVERAEWLDPVARPLSKAVARLIPSDPVKSLLSGTWLGHPLHPLLTDIPIGSWTSAWVLDLVGGKRSRPAADQLIGLGVVTALPTAAAGLADWSDYVGAERRVGLVHAGANVAAIGCYGLSYLARRRGARSRGLALSFLGAALATAGGYLGGHLSYAQGVNVNRNAWEEGLEEWTDVLDSSGLAEGRPVVVHAGGGDILLVRSGGQISALADRCGHAGGPLHEGSFGGDCVTCPWHQSTFRLADGQVVHGPATVPQPAFQVRSEGGRIQLRSLRH